MGIPFMLGVKITNALWAGIAIFIVYKLVTWYRRYTAWVASYDALPGKREKHWLWGHVFEVRVTICTLGLIHFILNSGEHVPAHE